MEIFLSLLFLPGIYKKRRTLETIYIIKNNCVNFTIDTLNFSNAYFTLFKVSHPCILSCLVLYFLSPCLLLGPFEDVSKRKDIYNLLCIKFSKVMVLSNFHLSY